MKILDVKQNTPEWKSARAGIPTASAFSRIVTPKTRKLSSQADEYMDRLLCEWVMGAPIEDDRETPWQAHGHEYEPQAVASYEFETGRDDVHSVGFVTTDDGLVGCSPDRMVGTDGLLEIKCPSPWHHIGYMRARDVDEAYQVQLDGQLWVCEREWVDIQSYFAGLPTVIIRVTRNEERIAQLAAVIRQFVDRMLAAREDLEKRFGPFTRIEPESKLNVPIERHERKQGLSEENAAWYEHLKSLNVRTPLPVGPQPDGTFVVDK